MPALPPAPNVIRINLDWTLQTSHGGGSRFYFHYTGGPPTDANLDTLATDVGTAYSANLASLAVAGIVLTNIVCTDLSTPTSAEGSAAVSIAGTLTGDNLPIDTCVNMRSVIARRYRGGRPKIFLPFGSQSSLNTGDDTWTSAFIDDVNAGWAAFKTALFALTGIGCTLDQHYNVSYYSGFASVQNPVTKRWRNIPTPRTGDAQLDTITSTTAQALVSQQRRRRLEPIPA
jgi:hypothetical protein